MTPEPLSGWVRRRSRPDEPGFVPAAQAVVSFSLAEDLDESDAEVGETRTSGVRRLTPRASLRRRGDWQQASDVDTRGLSKSEREALSHRWSQLGLAKHAQVAVSGRFVLNMLACGAPADLVERAQRAMGDVTRHARLAFGVASRYARRPIGPGRLLRPDVELRGDIAGIAVAVVTDGCIGSTVAAAATRAGAEAARDPAVASMLREMAADEAGHAEVAWRFVRWALAAWPELDTDVVHAVRAELDEARATYQTSHGDVSLMPHGFVSDAQRSRFRLTALEDLVLPAMRALCPRAAA